MNLSGISRFATEPIGAAIAFLIALLPERTKEQEPFSAFKSTGAHVLSGFSECVFALILFVYGYDRFVGELSLQVSSALAAEGAQKIPEAQMRTMGVGGYVLYLFHPMALISFYVCAEGIVRSNAARLSGRCHGISIFWAIHRIVAFVRSKRRQVVLREQLGPYELDACFKDKASGALVITSVEDKDWRERQVVQYRDDFYALSTRDFVRRGKYFRYRYTFRHMHPGEIIRGRLVVIP